MARFANCRSFFYLVHSFGFVRRWFNSAISSSLRGSTFPSEMSQGSQGHFSPPHIWVCAARHNRRTWRKMPVIGRLERHDQA